jgi:hypothetical protein
VKALSTSPSTTKKKERKALDKIQHPFRVKNNSQQSRNKEELPQPVGEHPQKPIFSIILHGEEPDAFP